MRFSLKPSRGSLTTGWASSNAHPVGRRQVRENRRRLRNRRIKAVLAGGLVFGIGAAGTLASWTDTETADGSFEAGTFNIELSANGSWDNTREMTFDATSMYPGSKVYAPVFVRTTADTTMDGALTVSGGGISGTPSALGSALSYRAVTLSIGADAVADFTCDSTTFAGSNSYVFGSASGGTALRAATTASTTQDLKASGGAVRAYCFEVTLPENTPNGAQGQSANHTWTFEAESIPAGS